MTSPNRSVIVRLAMEPSSYISGASRAAAATTALNGEVSKVGATSATSMERAAKSASATEGVFGKLNKTAGALGFTLGGLAGISGGIAAALSVKWAGDYQSALTKLATTAGESQKNLHMVGQGMLDMAGQVGVGADELAKGMYTVESSGIHGANALTVLKAAAQGAKQENADLSKVTDAVTTALHDYNLPASDAAKVTSQLVTAVSHGKTTFDELTGAMHSVTPLAAALHVPLADIAGTLSAMTASGESADQAAQNMADALRHLQSPTSTMTSELGQLGINSAELGPMLGQKGLAGTIQYISSAIVDHLDPATKQVLLPALNQSKSAAKDLQIMLGQMPPTLAKLASGLMDGSVSLKDYRTKVRDLGGTAEVMGNQFMGLFQSSQGFSNILKSGSPAAQEYTAALQKAMGTSAGLTVALQVTGEHAAATNSAIKDIARSAGDASGNIRGWDEVQGNFNQQLAQAEQGIKSMAIEAGQHLLPALTGAFGYVNRDVLPGIEHLGSWVGDAAHAFMGIPAPIRDATGALVALKVVTGTDMFAGLVASGRVLAVGFANDMENMVASARAGAGSITAAFAEAKAAQQALTAEKFGMDLSMVSKATGDIAGLGAAAKTAASGGFAAMRSAGGSLVDMLGGPWVLAAAAATAGVVALVKSSEAHTAAVKKETDSLVALMKAQEGGGSAAVAATSKMDDFRKKISDLQHQIDDATGSQVEGGKRADLYGAQQQSAGDHVAELRKELAAAKDQMSTYHAALTPVETATNAVAKAHNDLNDALKHNAPDSMAVASAVGQLHDAENQLASATSAANDAQKTQSQRLQDQANKAIASWDATRNLQLAQLDLKDAMAQYNQDVADGTLKGDALTRSQLQLQGQAEQVAQAAADAAKKQALQNGATDTGAASQAAYRDALQKAADQMTGPSHKAIEDLIIAMGDSGGAADTLAGKFELMGLNVTNSWKGAAAEVSGASAAQIQNMHDLGFAVMHLPNGHIIVSADTNPAQDEINAMLIAYRAQTIILRSQMGDPGGTSRRMGAPATGGWIAGPGTGTSDTAGVFRLSHGEFVVNAAAAKQNASLLTSINGGANVHTSGVPVLPGYAAGGFIGQPPMTVGRETVTVHMDPASLAAQLADMLAPLKAAAAAAAPGAPTSVLGNAAIVQRMAAARGWTGPEWNALYALVMRESGFRNTAQNPTSSAYGMFQFLNSTWGAYGGGKTSDPTAQTRMGLDYIRGKYRDPLGAWAHETKFGWYDGGGKLEPGLTMALNTTGKQETIRTAEQEAIVQRALRSREMFGSAGGGSATAGGVSRTVQGQVFNGPVTITDSDAMAAKSYRHAAMAAARFQ